MAIFYLYIFLCVASIAVMLFMQVVHYPLMPFVDAAKWSVFTEKRRLLTSIILYPLMAFEVFSGFTLTVIATKTESYGLLAATVIILVCLVIYTLAYLNPQMKKINGPDDKANHEKFIKLHWIRTLGCIARFLLILLILLAA